MADTTTDSIHEHMNRLQMKLMQQVSVLFTFIIHRRRKRAAGGGGGGGQPPPPPGRGGPGAAPPIINKFGEGGQHTL